MERERKRFLGKRKKTKISFPIPAEEGSEELVSPIEDQGQGQSQDQGHQDRHQDQDQAESQAPLSTLPQVRVQEREEDGERDLVPEAGAPSAPPLDEVRADALRNRNKLLARVYALLAGQMTIFGGLTMLFVYEPHMRKIFRKNVFDKLFLGSLLGFPLCIVVVPLLFFPAIRRKYSWTALTIITASLSLLLAYVLTIASAEAFMASILSSDLCCLGVIASTRVPKIDLTSKKGLLYFPAFMLAANAGYPSLAGLSWKQTIAPSLITTGLMTYFGYNSRSIIRINELDIQPHEYPFAASQHYFNFDVIKSIGGLLSRRRRGAQSYTRIP